MGGPPRGPDGDRCKNHPCEKFLIWKNINIFPKKLTDVCFSVDHILVFLLFCVFFVGEGGGICYTPLLSRHCGVAIFRLDFGVGIHPGVNPSIMGGK